MVDAALILDALILTSLLAILLRSHFKGEEVHDRLDDVIDGVGLFATEVLKRTEELREMGSAMAPAIELHNHNPLEQIFSFINQMKNGNFSAENITNPRGSDGRYGPTQEQEQIPETSPEIIDILD